jgi:hypothetical protein
MASLKVKIVGQIDELLTSLKKAEREMTVFSKRVSRIGEELTKSLTLPIAGLGFVAVKNFGEAEKALAGLESQLRANGKDVKAVMADYQAFAVQMQQVTTVDDGAAIGLLQLAESMQAVDAKKATQDAIGLSKAFGVDLNSAMKMVVQSQNGIYTMLGRTIPAIRAAKTETEKAAVANKAFADGFEIAKEQAKRGLGPLEQLKNQLLDLSESFGKIIVEAITPIVKLLRSFAEWLDGLSETQRKWVAGIGLAVAALGPLLLVVGKIPAVLAAVSSGITLLLPLVKSLWTVLAANPWIALAAGIAFATVKLLSYIDTQNMLAANKAMEQQSKREVQAKKDIEEYVKADKEGRKAILDGLRKQGKAYEDLWNKAKLANDTAGMEHYRLQIALINVLAQDMKEAAKTAFTPPPSALSGIVGINNELEKTKKNLDDVGKKFDFLGRLIEPLVSTAGDMLTMVSKPFTGFTGVGGQTGLVEDRGITKPGTIAQPGALDVNATVIAANKMREAFDAIADSVGGIYTRIKDTFGKITNVVIAAAEGFKDGWKSAAALVLEAMSSAMALISEIITASNQRRMDEMEAYYDRERERIRGSTMSEEQKNKALAKLDKEAEKKRKELAREAAKDQKAAAIIQAIINGALAVTAALTVPYIGVVLAIIVGALAAAQIALIASQPLPALAQGGLAYAPQMALVGDNPNARYDPEVISPLSKLRDYLGFGNQHIVVYGELRGEDILISSERANEQRIRTRGF